MAVSGAWTYTLSGGNATITDYDEFESVLGSAAGAFVSGVPDYLSVPDTAGLDFTNGDFTVEMFVMFASTSDFRVLYSQGDPTGTTNYWEFAKTNTDSFYFKDVVSGSNNIYYYTAPGQIVANKWYHLAFVRNGSNFYIFKDGVSLSLTESVAIGTKTIASYSDEYYIGAHVHDAAVLGAMHGYLDEFRVSIGIARWTSGFTPPSSEYSSDTYTQLLLHMNGTTGSTTFTDDGENSLTVTVYGDAEIRASGGGYNPTIPTTLDGYPVIALANNAMDNKGLQSVTINHTIELNDNCLAFNSGMAVNLNANCTDGISIYLVAAFEGCNIGTGLTIGASVTNIDDYLFYTSGISGTLNLPSSVTTIGVSAFASCSITGVNIDNVTSIANGAFGSNNISSVTFNNPSLTLGAAAFKNNTGIDVIINTDFTYTSSHNGGVFTGCSIGSGITIAEGVTILGKAIFENAGVTSITLPDTMTLLDDYCLWQNTGLTSINLNNVTTIDSNALAYCGLTSINIDNVTSIKDGALRNNPLTSISFNNPSLTVTTYSFASCTSLTAVNLNVDINSTAAPTGGAFAGSGLGDAINIASGVTTIPDAIFQNSGVTSITFPSSVTTIESYAFRDNPNLGSVNIDNITWIGTEAFRNCGLTSISFNNPSLFISSGAFSYNYGVTINLNVNITSGSVSQVVGVFQGSNLTGDNINIGESVTSIFQAFFAQANLTDIVFPEGVTTIGSYALYNNDKLVSVTFNAKETVTFGTGVLAECAPDEFTKNIIPTMTSNVLPSGVASASSEYSSSYAAWKAFDKNNGTYWATTTGGVLPSWLEYQFTEPKTCIGYTVRCRSDSVIASPNTWKLQGYNGSTWDDLDSQTGKTFTTSERKDFTFSNSTAYTRYRIYVTANNGGTTTSIAEFTLHDDLTQPTIYGYDSSVETWAGGYSTYYDYVMLSTGRIKKWNGSEWVVKPIKKWSGSEWVTKPVKKWSGSEWV